MTNRIKSVVLAALALSVLLVQPVCDAHEAGAGDPAACSASIADAVLDDFADAPPGYKPAQPVAAVSSAVRPAAASRAAAAAPRDHPPASLPYHARSARILS